jgi:hypothetical protein
MLTARKGMFALEILLMEIFPMLEATKRHTPTGGVVRPIMRFSTAIMEKWIGSIPTWRATASSVGKRVSSAAMVSMKVPTKRSSKLIIRMIRNLFFVIPRRKSATIWGICSLVNIHAKRFASPTSTMIDAVVIEASRISPGRSLKERSR